MATNSSELPRWVASHRETRAASFLDILSPVSGALSGPGGMPHSHLYRGVGDLGYSLLPSAFRPTVQLFQKPHFPRGLGKTQREQIERELQTLAAFINAADRQGHQIPEDSQQLRATLRSLQENLAVANNTVTLKEWPPTSLLSVLALAQHYGVPTRLLDWSLDPYVAAYFAATSAMGNDEGYLAVWAVVSDLFEINNILIGDPVRAARLPIQYVTTPWAGNANAKAQRAVFLAYRQFDINLSSDFVPEAYDALIAKNLVGGLPAYPVLYRFSLPRSEAPELLRLLAFQGYDGATLFPGLEGAVKSIAESYLWRRDSDTDPRSCRSVQAFNNMT
ncbi:FRG domain protein [Rhizobium leguminosarum bv. trifolii WSM597]|uniref:FRG domain protein n=1 Tax=Rhizobium leguminosarum bv. trifolii WSM597 TaxID=754764 RepID=I9N4Y5_RHILT|nr:FRG domain-containing protein [Rhizobium leguminosarum]EJB01757.1 FRG domain protein [Rhizobium leguminosarum bv. trifolii WSM597]